MAKMAKAGSSDDVLLNSELEDPEAQGETIFQAETDLAIDPGAVARAEAGDDFDDVEAEEDPEDDADAEHEEAAETNGPSSEIVRITHGSAAGWSLKVSLVNGYTKWFARRPRGTKWEQLSKLQESADVSQALEQERKLLADSWGHARTFHKQRPNYGELFVEDQTPRQDDAFSERDTRDGEGRGGSAVARPLEEPLLPSAGDLGELSTRKGAEGSESSNIGAPPLRGESPPRSEGSGAFKVPTASGAEATPGTITEKTGAGQAAHDIGGVVGECLAADGQAAQEQT